MGYFLKKILILFLILISPFVFLISFLFFLIRKVGIQNIPIYRKIFNTAKVFPIIDHYYEPLFNPKHLHKPLDHDRELLGIDFNIKGQLDLLNEFNFTDELIKFPILKTSENEFYYENKGFEAGDAEILYSFVRHFKPNRIFEIGSGNSTLMAVNALEKNTTEDPDYNCEHICIEPYEMKWLEQKNVKVVRKVVEKTDKDLFRELKKNDILFIDSSHIIRTQGDVLFEYLEIFPILNPGVLIHVHDIFTPKDYPEDWIINQVRLWNEQYLLEAFLSHNKDFQIISALNFLKHNYFDGLSKVCPVLKNNVKAEPGSFWIVRN